MSFKKNIRDLISDAYRFQYTRVNDTNETAKRRNPLCYFTKSQWLFIIISLILASITTKGLRSDFAGYIISGLSLFVGVFFTFLITLYDKFQRSNFLKDENIPNDEDVPQMIKRRNFFKKISVLSLYSVLLSILLIVLLSLTLLYQNEIGGYINIIEFFKLIKSYQAAVIFKTACIFLYRTVTFYFLFDFISIAIFIVTSYYDFLIDEIQNKKNW